MVAEAGAGLGELHPDLVDRAIACERYPEFPLGRLKPHSNEYVLWTCHCGRTTRQKVQNVTRKAAVICSDCRPVGKSRWEFEVAELLRAMLDADVQTHHGTTRSAEVDLYVGPPYNAAIELDPLSTHRDKVTVDVAQLNRKSIGYARMTRIREEGLESIKGCLVVPRRSSALLWAETVAEWAAPSQWRVLPDHEVRDALRRGAASWYRLPQTAPDEPLSAYSDLAAEFVENMDVPGRIPEWISRGSGDLCRWRCAKEHLYECPVYQRTGKQGVGCPTCGAARSAQARRAPLPGRSAADEYPQLAAEFVANLTRPGVVMSQMRPHCHDRCIWRCSLCENEWSTTLHTRSSGAGSGLCRSCRLRAHWRERRQRTHGTYWDQQERARMAMTSFVEAHGHAGVPHDQVWEGYALGEQVKRWRARYKQGASASSEAAEQRSDGLDETTRTWLDSLPGWQASPRDDAWHAKIRQLRAMASDGETIDVAVARSEDAALSNFVSKSRAQYRNGIRPDRYHFLEAIPGWTWQGPGRGRRPSADLPDRRR